MITLASRGTKRSMPPNAAMARRTIASGSPARATTRSGEPDGAAVDCAGGGASVAAEAVVGTAVSGKAVLAGCAGWTAPAVGVRVSLVPQAVKN